MEKLHEGSIKANGIEFGYLSTGPEDGPLALCLHGFPDSAYTWSRLLPRLAAAGFHAVAPFMRGYAPTSIPEDGAYQSGALASDAVALHAALGGGPDAVLIGHDWGAAAAYGAAASSPGRWRKVVAMAGPPAAAMGDAFLDYQQLKRSFYIFLFQTPLAEAALDRTFIENVWRDWSPHGKALPVQTVEQAVKCLSRPQNATAAIGYYRALFDATTHNSRYESEQRAVMARGERPVLYLHGAVDGCLPPETVAPDGDLNRIVTALPPGSRAEIVPEAGHFLHVDQPEDVNNRILTWLTT